MLKEKVNLIPRYNWDYRISDFIKAMTAIFRPPSDTDIAMENIFGRRPVFTTSGRTSLYAILRSLNLPEGSGVGVPLFCCPVVFDAVKQANLTPEFIDIDPEDYNISAADLEKRIGSLSAIVVVHMFGHPADMDSISSVSGGIPIIEDCAQSLFSRYKDQYTGVLSDVSFFSFRSGKYISAGEGSAIFCSDPKLLNAIRSVVEALETQTRFQEIMHCTTTLIKSTLYRRPWYGTVGYPIGTRIDRKLNLTAKDGFNLSKAARSDLRIIDDRLDTFAEKVKKQRDNSCYLLKNIRLKNVVLPREKENCRTNYYQFVIRFDSAERRDHMADYLFKQGIDTAKYLDEVIDVASGQYDYTGDCPDAEHCSKTVLSVPNHYTLSRQDLDHIVKCLNDGGKVADRS